MQKKATIYDFRRMCNTYPGCEKCPLDGVCSFNDMDNMEIEISNTVILKWCEQHPIKTRLTEFKKLFPNCAMDEDGYPEECICYYDKDIDCPDVGNFTYNQCSQCAQKFWDEEVTV